VRIVKDWGYQLVPIGPSSLPPGILTGFTYGCEWQEGNWRNAHELELTFEAIKTMAKKLGGASKFKSAMKGIPIDVKRYTDFLNWAGFAPHPSIDQFFGEVMLFNGAFNSSDQFAKEVVVHETAHVWDFRHGFELSNDLVKLTNPYKRICTRNGCVVVWDPNSAIERFATSYARTNKIEYWAESVMVYIFPSSGYLGPIVQGYVETKIQEIR